MRKVLKYSDNKEKDLVCTQEHTGTRFFLVVLEDGNEVYIPEVDAVKILGKR